MFKLLVFTICALLISQAVSASEERKVQIRHSASVYAGFGQCSAKIAVYSHDGDMEALDLAVSVFDSQEQLITTDTLTLHARDLWRCKPGTCGALFFEHEAACNDGLKIRVDRAEAVIDGQEVDLIESGILAVRDFNPFKIQIGD
ncbi:MAG: hypothetical protein JJT95_05985 [Pararhodobacter sp.]|nr:hypothetical protein [Pararhodobacter sp.]